VCEEQDIGLVEPDTGSAGSAGSSSGGDDNVALGVGLGVGLGVWLLMHVDQAACRQVPYDEHEVVHLSSSCWR